MAAGAALAEQVPALVEGDLQRLQSLGRRVVGPRRADRPLQGVLLLDERADALDHVCIVHGTLRQQVWPSGGVPTWNPVGSVVLVVGGGVVVAVVAAVVPVVSPGAAGVTDSIGAGSWCTLVKSRPATSRTCAGARSGSSRSSTGAVMWRASRWP